MKTNSANIVRYPGTPIWQCRQWRAADSVVPALKYYNRRRGILTSTTLGPFSAYYRTTAVGTPSQEHPDTSRNTNSRLQYTLL